MAIINKSKSNMCWQGGRKKGTIVHCWWEYRLVQPLWKTVQSFIKKLKMVQQFHCWEYTLRILKHQSKRTYASLPMFTAALLAMAKCWKHPKCPSVDEWIKKLVRLPNGILRSKKRKKKEFLPFETARMELESITLNQIARQ